MKSILVQLFSLIILLTLFSCETDSQQHKGKRFKFINTSNKNLEVQFNSILPSGKLDSLAEVFQLLEPGTSKLRYVDTGLYRITVWDGDNVYKEDFDYRVVPIKSDSIHNVNEAYSLSTYYFDLAQDKNYALVNASYLYEASNSLTEAISSDGSDMKMYAKCSGSRPFLIDDFFINNSNMGFVDWGEKLEEEKSAFQATHSLIAIPKDIFFNNEERTLYIHNELVKLLPQ